MPSWTRLVSRYKATQQERSNGEGGGDTHRDLGKHRLLHYPLHELMRNPEKHSRAIARVLLTATRTTMVHALREGGVVVESGRDWELGINHDACVVFRETSRNCRVGSVRPCTWGMTDAV